MRYNASHDGFTSVEKPAPSLQGNTNPLLVHTESSLTGFTLVETLVAISILLLVVIGPITVAQKGIQNAYYANEQLIAVFLAQEAMEGVRKLRDDTALRVWCLADEGSSDCGGSDTDTASWIPSGCVNGCSKMAYYRDETEPGSIFQTCTDCLVYRNSDGVYTQEAIGNTRTIFKREVTISQEASGGRKVTVDVYWRAVVFGQDRHVILRSYIYDQYERFTEAAAAN